MKVGPSCDEAGDSGDDEGDGEGGCCCAGCCKLGVCDAGDDVLGVVGGSCDDAG